MTNIDEEYLKQIEYDLTTISSWAWDLKDTDYRSDEDWLFIAKSPERIAALVKRVRELEKALEFYADENNTVRPCMAGGYESSTFCANVDLCRLAQEVLKKSSGKE